MCKIILFNYIIIIIIHFLSEFPASVTNQIGKEYKMMITKALVIHFKCVISLKLVPNTKLHLIV